MKTVITIDFDIIMAPSINLYNNDVPRATWDILLNSPYMQLLTIDSWHYQRLTQFILKCFSQMDKENIHFINSHEHVVNCIRDNEEYSIVNIDHHHDVCYNPKDIENKCDELTCANWLKWLRENKIIRRYLWIHNKNSTMPADDIKDMVDTEITIEDFDLDKLAVPDELVICLSPSWVPPNYRDLFFIWMDIANTIYHIHFDLED